MSYNYLEKLRRYRRNKTSAKKVLQEELKKLANAGSFGLTPEVHDIIEALGIPMQEVRLMLKTMINNSSTNNNEKGILGYLCQKEGVEMELVEELIKIEKDFRLKRMGIYEKLKETVERTIEQNEI